jgi:acyl-CoA reductase-like NAD-dependent aldehyde dehydrogenase
VIPYEDEDDAVRIANDSNIYAADLPFGGYKDSGVGRAVT